MQKYPELLANARSTLSLRNWLLEITPPQLWDQFLFIAYIQWIGLAVVLAIGIIINLVVRLLFGVLLKRWIERGLMHMARHAEQGRIDIRRSCRAIGLVASILFWGWLVDLLFLPLVAYNFISITLNVLLVFSMINAGFKLTDLVGDVVGLRAASTQNKLDDIVVPT